MLAIFSLNDFGSFRIAFSTSASNCRRVMRPRRLEPTDPFHVDHVGHVADGGHDLLQLPQVGDLDHEVVDAAAVVGHGDLGLGDVAVAGGDGTGDLGQEARAVVTDVDGDAHRTLGRLLHV